ncbi:hypothetical protein GCM10010121_081090 [Streptomyces brasiliensis]|uniref:Uncharacterized protein n=1 Tax=Streptomyces brasiliensis TaxID=1954 RepID=A0A917LBX2_9ACTN|nr:hypothetical protein GCM10010121_081090 [Streptomyces brasiliensis]
MVALTEGAMSTSGEQGGRESMRTIDRKGIAAETEFAGVLGLDPGDTCGRDLSGLLLARSAGDLPHRFIDLCAGRVDWLTEPVAGNCGTGRTFCANQAAVPLAGTAGPARLVMCLSAQGNRTRSVTVRNRVSGTASGASARQLDSCLHVSLSRRGVEYRVGRLPRRFVLCPGNASQTGWVPV